VQLTGFPGEVFPVTTPTLTLSPTAVLHRCTPVQYTPTQRERITKDAQRQIIDQINFSGFYSPCKGAALAGFSLYDGGFTVYI